MAGEWSAMIPDKTTAAIIGNVGADAMDADRKHWCENCGRVVLVMGKSAD